MPAPRMIAGLAPRVRTTTPQLRSPARRMSSGSTLSPVVAVLYQAIDPPIINGVRKPKKPGGYQDSGADIAYTLANRTHPATKDTTILTPTANPSPSSQDGWCFPDTEEGIHAAVSAGATHLWANTIVFNAHPLQASPKLAPYAKNLRVIGQPPTLVENFDDKAYLNGKLREKGGFTMVQAREVQASKASDDSNAWKKVIGSIPDAQFPIVGKPVRGRGSHGVKLCQSRAELEAHVESLLAESPVVMLEEYLAGEEATVTVMPPCNDDNDAPPRYTSLPPVTRFNHDDGVAPYNGVLAVSRNSRVVTDAEMDADAHYAEVMRECERVAEVIQAAAPIRIDVRRFREGSRFALFDINMKPNMTGPGRPGREDQASLTAIAAAALGWDYPTLLQRILQSAKTLETFRAYKPPF